MAADMQMNFMQMKLVGGWVGGWGWGGIELVEQID